MCSIYVISILCWLSISCLAARSVPQELKEQPAWVLELQAGGHEPGWGNSSGCGKAYTGRTARLVGLRCQRGHTVHKTSAQLAATAKHTCKQSPSSGFRLASTRRPTFCSTSSTAIPSRLRQAESKAANQPCAVFSLKDISSLAVTYPIVPLSNFNDRGVVQRDSKTRARRHAWITCLEYDSKVL